MSSTSSKIAGIIPARYGSVRLPGKLLYLIKGKPLIQHTYERASAAKALDDLIIATDDERIFEAVTDFGGKAVMTSPDHRSGTERAAEVVEKTDCDIIVNIQGDEPTIMAESIDRVAELLKDNPSADMGTLAYVINDPSELNNINAVKVTIDKNGYALYFSRAMIPHTKSGLPQEDTTYYHHVGIYSYRRELILKWRELPPSQLEITEELEQLRALENGYNIKVGITRHKSIDVNTHTDFERIKEIL